MVHRSSRVLPLLLILLASCTKDGGTPAYIRLAPPVVVSANGHDTISSKITDIWVYANDAPAGVWQADRRIPVLASGSISIKLVAGIRHNGITDDRIQYPYYQTFQQQVDLVPTSEITIRPKFTYYDNLTYWTENFEDAGDHFDVTGDTLHHVDTIPDPMQVFQGSHSGAFFLNAQSPHIMCVNSSSLGDFPSSVVSAFLEIDYRSNIRFLVGIRYFDGSSTQTIPYVYVSPTASNGTMPWNHVYIDLGTAWNSVVGEQKHFYIEGQLESGEASGEVFLDNVNVIYH